MPKRGEPKSPEGIRTTTCIIPVKIATTSNYVHQLSNSLCAQHYLSQLNKASDYPMVTVFVSIYIPLPRALVLTRVVLYCQKPYRAVRASSQ